MKYIGTKLNNIWLLENNMKKMQIRGSSLQLLKWKYSLEIHSRTSAKWEAGRKEKAAATVL